MPKVDKWSLAVGAAVLVLVGILCVAVIQEHTARVAADAQVKVLETQKTEVRKEAKAKVQALRVKAEEVKTPAQAVEHIPEVTLQPLAPVALPELPGKVAVLAVPLYRELNQCAQDRVNLEACQKTAKLDEAEITALKKKPGFWHRVKGTAITLGVGAAAGYALSKR